MQAIIKPREITEDIQNDGSIRMYLEFEFSKPGEIARVNITKQNAQFINLCRELIGKEVVVGLERGEMNGRPFWRITDNNFQLVKLGPITLTSTTQQSGTQKVA
ncbi:MAG: hypothetical protein PHY54_17025 [Methylococcales bacterium]|nr:hypothetical protein [Methylococcales bacterium]